MFRSRIIQVIFNLLNVYLVQKITVAAFREFVQSRVNNLAKVADILTDKNPENNQQLLELWNEVKEDVKDDGIDVAIEIIQKRVKNAALREFIIALLLEEQNGILSDDRMLTLRAMSV